MSNFEYDDKQLWQLFETLTERERVKLLRGAMRDTAKMFKKKYVARYESSTAAKFRNGKWQKAARIIVFKKQAGFRFTLGSKK